MEHRNFGDSKVLVGSHFLNGPIYLIVGFAADVQFQFLPSYMSATIKLKYPNLKVHGNKAISGDGGGIYQSIAAGQLVIMNSKVANNILRVVYLVMLHTTFQGLCTKVIINHTIQDQGNSWGGIT